MTVHSLTPYPLYLGSASIISIVQMRKLGLRELRLAQGYKDWHPDNLAVPS